MNFEIPRKYDWIIIFAITYCIVLFLFLILKIGWILSYFTFIKIFFENPFESQSLVHIILNATLLMLVGIISASSFIIVKIVMKKKLIMAHIFSIIIISVFLFVIFSASTTLVLLPSKGLVDDFKQTYSINPLPTYLDDISDFITYHIEFSQWGSLKLDDMLLKINFNGIALDYPFLNLFSINRADLIVYQGYGSCGENAMLIQELLLPTSYETRLAMYVNQDHMWCEIYFNNQWQIIDIGHGFLGKFQPLIVAKTGSINATGVLIMSSNGTWVDDSIEHGFE